MIIEYGFGYDPRKISEQELFDDIVSYPTLNSEKKEIVDLKILSLMEGYIKGFAKKFAEKSQKTVYDDYYQEMATMIVSKIPTLKLNKEKFIGKQISSYLYYWLDDCCQKFYSSQEYATNISLSKAKKVVSSDDLLEKYSTTKTVSLNNIVKKNDENVAEYHESFVSKQESQIHTFYKRMLKELITKKFGENTFDIFVKIYVDGKKGTVEERKRLFRVIEYIKANDDLKEMIKELVESGEGLI